MKRSKCICIFLIVCGLILAVFLLRTAPWSLKEKPGTQEIQKEENVQPSAAQTYAYRIVVEEEYLVVYKTTETEAYLHTDICLTSLPEEVQRSVLKGMTFATEKELYDFLENYSS